MLRGLSSSGARNPMALEFAEFATFTYQKVDRELDKYNVSGGVHSSD